MEENDDYIVTFIISLFAILTVFYISYQGFIHEMKFKETLKTMINNEYILNE